MANPRSNEVALAGNAHQNGHGPLELFVPRIDVTQLEDKIVVRADLPGLVAEDVRITCDRGALVLEGERHYEREEHQGEVIRAERTYGRFQRIVPLPDAADPANADARFENGVLEITIPAPIKDRGKPIAIKAGR